jgi:molybdenum cofactor cytidylyltransferase
MGQPKLLLPWGDSTVLGHVIETLKQADIQDVVVVTGGARARVEALVGDSARVIFNSGFAGSEMLASLQCGLRAQLPEAQAALVCLGDQPQIQESSVRLVCEVFRQTSSSLVVPSYRMRRGHPWLIARVLWKDLLELKSPQTPRHFLNTHAQQIEYVNVDTPTVIQDLDTPQDYLKFKP